MQSSLSEAITAMHLQPSSNNIKEKYIKCINSIKLFLEKEFVNGNWIEVINAWGTEVFILKQDETKNRERDSYIENV